MYALDPWFLHLLPDLEMHILSFIVKVEQLNETDLRFGSVSEPKNSSILLHLEGI